MGQFIKADRPELQTTIFYISDSHGHTAELSPAEAYDLLEWLYTQRADIHRLVHPDTPEPTTPVQATNLPAWVTEEAPAQTDKETEEK
jgi:aromatic ring-cleaving dioxygenase